MTLNVEGHPVLTELKEFLLEFEDSDVDSVQSFETPIAFDSVSPESKSGGSIVDTAEKEKCSSCGASQMRQNGTCMLCEVCGETTGCS